MTPVPVRVVRPTATRWHGLCLPVGEVGGYRLDTMGWPVAAYPDRHAPA